MRKLIAFFLVFVSVFGSIESGFALDEERTYRSVLKIRTYDYNVTNDTYSLSHIGSAVAIGSGLLLTNAHVVFDQAQEKPTGYYEVCRTLDFRKKAVCFTTGELLAYDETSDLAIVRYTQPRDLPGVSLFQESKINIGARLVVYGYPGIGGENISRTEGNVAGYEEPFYKIDGAIDHGNSGGWAFNKYGELIGMPSRVASDNAVIGYMIPITTIRDFLAKRTPGYTKVSLRVPTSFREFARASQAGDKSKDIINDANIRTLSLKKYGLKYSGKLEGSGLFIYVMSLANLSEGTLVYSCNRVAGALDSEQLDTRDGGDFLKKYSDTRVVLAGGRYVMRSMQSLVSTERDDLIRIYDTQSTCAYTLRGVSIERDRASIAKVVNFATSWLTLKKSYPRTTGFHNQLMHIASMPTGVSISETSDTGWDSSISLGYFSIESNTGETSSDIVQRSRDTRDAYFIGSKSSYDPSPSDADIQPADYSYETLRTLYAKEYNPSYSDSKMTFEILTTKNGKKIIIGTTTYLASSSDLAQIVISYPYTIQNWSTKEYRELTYSNSYEWGNAAALAWLKEFWLQTELVWDAPF